MRYLDLDPATGIPSRLSLSDLLLGADLTDSPIEDFEQLLAAAREEHDAANQRLIAAYILERNPNHREALQVVADLQGEPNTCPSLTLTLVDVISDPDTLPSIVLTDVLDPES